MKNEEGAAEKAPRLPRRPFNCTTNAPQTRPWYSKSTSLAEEKMDGERKRCYAQTATTSSQKPAPAQKKAQTADNEVQKMVGHQEGHPTQPQGWSVTLKQEDPQHHHVKKEEEEPWTTQEGEHFFQPEEDNLTKLSLTVVSITNEDHEDKPPESSCWLCPSDARQLIGRQKERTPQPQGWSATLKQDDLQPPHVKKEEEEKDGERIHGQEEAELTKLPLTVVSVKTEDHEEKTPDSSQFHHSPSGENRGAEPPSSSSPQHMTAGAEGDHCEGSQADNLLAPLSNSDDTASQSSEYEDGDDTREPLSRDTDCEGDVRTHTDSKHYESSTKKAGIKHATCSVCGKTFHRCNLARHMLTHTGEKPFSCSVCFKTFATKSYLTRHMATHTGEKPFACSVCGQRFSLKEQKVLHMKKHTEEPFRCSVCGKKYSFKSSLTNHILTHSEDKSFGCSVCGQRFSKKCLVESHMRKHTGEKPFSCSVCDKSYSLKWNLTFHMRKHTGDKSFWCSVCGQRFPRKSFMVSHMTAHTGEKPFSCSICGKSYSYKAGLTYHMRKHIGEKYFACSVCGQRFPRKASMVDHMRRHTGEPVCCSLCGESFSQRSQLTYHMRKHKGKKPFSCSVCGQRFSEKQASICHTTACQDVLGSASAKI